MDKVKVKVQVVTLTYNKKELLRQLADSLFNTCKETPWAWTILDNGDDDTKELIVKEFPSKVFVEYKKHNNSGNFAVQNNHCILSSCIEPEIIIFLNNDIISHCDFITNFYNLLQNPKIGCVGAILRYGDNSLQHAGVLLQENAIPANLGQKAYEILGLHNSVLKPEKWKNPLVMNAVTAACMGIRSVDFSFLRGFHDEFSWCFEDVDLCLRMQMRMGKFCVLDPRSELTHLETQTKVGDRNVSINGDILQGRYMGFVKADYNLFQDETYLRVRDLNYLTVPSDCSPDLT